MGMDRLFALLDDVVVRGDTVSFSSSCADELNCSMKRMQEYSMTELKWVTEPSEREFGDNDYLPRSRRDIWDLEFMGLWRTRQGHISLTQEKAMKTPLLFGTNLVNGDSGVEDNTFHSHTWNGAGLNGQTGISNCVHDKSGFDTNDINLYDLMEKIGTSPSRLFGTFRPYKFTFNSPFSSTARRLTMKRKLIHKQKETLDYS